MMLFPRLVVWLVLFLEGVSSHGGVRSGHQQHPPLPHAHSHDHDHHDEHDHHDDHDHSMLHPHPHRSLDDDDHHRHFHRRNDEGLLMCGTPHPTQDELREELRARQEAAEQQQQQDEDNASLLRVQQLFSRLWQAIRRLWRRAFGETKTAISTYYHIITTTDRPGPTIDQVYQQHNHLVGAFSSSDFTFVLEEITQTESAAWYGYSDFNTPEERDMKTTLRRGGSASLNVYLNGANGYCGYAYLPKFYADFPWNDGIVVHHSCFLQGSPGQEGDTMVHEVGHWMGLLHTFSGCDEPGDGVSDTNTQRNPTSGCPERPQNSCGAGLDPIHNYMDYSADTCRSQFTQGQNSRMNQEWQEYRALSGTAAAQRWLRWW